MVNETVADSIWAMKSLQDYVDDWPLMKSPLPLFTIWVSYMVFVLKAGPKFMKERPAFKLTNIVTVYNIFQVLFSLYMVLIGLNLLRPIGYIHLACNLDKDTTRKLTGAIYLYFTAKVSELLETIFFVLRKKQNQVSLLHVYHHSSMIWAPWFTLKFEPTYSTIFLGTLNSFVHVIMYTYYGLSAFPSLSKYLWWKKYITSMQLTQFVTMIVHMAFNYVNSECPPSYILFTLVTINTLIIMYLFGEFYVRSYLKKKPKVDSITTKASNGLKSSNGVHSHKNGVPVEANGTDKKVS